MNWLNRAWRSSLGKKYVMAISGCVLVMFVVGHMVGNLQIFLPPHYINHYAAFLQGNLELLWPVRVLMLTLVALHVTVAIQLWAENKAARPVAYAQQELAAASYASKTMVMSGLILGSFIIYHLLHYTVVVQSINLTGRDFGALIDPDTGHRDVYAMLIYGFSNKFVSLFYLVAMGLLCLHLSHGIQAMFQSIGWKNTYYGPLLDRAAKLIAVVLFVGYCSIPVAVLLGYGQDHLKQIESKAPVKQMSVGKE